MTKRERDLVLAARGGDADAFAELVQRCWPMILNRCSRKVWNKDTADDLARKAVLKVWEKHDQLNPEGNFGAYIAKVAENLCLDWMRREGRRGPLAESKLVSTDTVIEGEEGGINTVITLIDDPNTYDPETRCLLKLAIDQTMQRLPSDYRELLSTRYVDGRSAAEIAKYMGCAEQTVRNRLRHAEDLFKKYFAEEWGDYAGNGSQKK